MVWIITENDGLRRLFNEDVMPPGADPEADREDYDVKFSENNTANVKEAVAEAYVQHYDDIHYKTDVEDEERSESDNK
jgi:hypothetical protein